MALVVLFSANAQTDCKSYAKKAMQAEFMAYGFDSQEAVNEAINFYYNACTEAGGDIENPVFI
jgi:hypothetical protein